MDTHRLRNIVLAASSSNEPLGLGKIFSDPAALTKLAANPRTAKHLADPTFVQQVYFLLRSTG
jgi:stress-induced-phosphoprotein 1